MYYGTLTVHGAYRYPPKSDEEKKGEEEEASEKDAAGHFKGGAHFKCMSIVETGKRVKMLHGQVPPHEWQGALVGGQRDDGLIEFGYDNGDIMLYKLERGA